jgi:hypothetical protein
VNGFLAQNLNKCHLEAIKNLNKCILWIKKNAISVIVCLLGWLKKQIAGGVAHEKKDI